MPGKKTRKIAPRARARRKAEDALTARIAEEAWRAFAVEVVAAMRDIADACDQPVAKLAVARMERKLAQLSGQTEMFT